MKKLYLIASLLVLAVWVKAQISGCNDPRGGIQIIFDESMNCSNAPGDLAGMQQIGFHSGANQWAAVVDWDAAGATRATNDGNDVFSVYLADPNAYYGTTVSNIYFVFNQGPINSSSPWDSEGKKDDGSGGCADFSITLSSITETCAVTTSLEDLALENEIVITPNPFVSEANISIDNPTKESFTITVTSLTGKLISVDRNFNGSNYILRRDNMAPGMYFVTFQNKEGRFATQKVVVK